MYAPLVPPLLTGRPIMPLCLVVLPFPVHPHLCCPCHETTEQQGAGTEYACLVLVDLTVVMQPQMDELPMVWPCISVVNTRTASGPSQAHQKNRAPTSTFSEVPNQYQTSTDGQTMTDSGC